MSSDFTEERVAVYTIYVFDCPMCGARVELGEDCPDTEVECFWCNLTFIGDEV